MKQEQETIRHDRTLVRTAVRPIEFMWYLSVAVGSDVAERVHVWYKPAVGCWAKAGRPRYV